MHPCHKPFVTSISSNSSHPFSHYSLDSLVMKWPCEVHQCLSCPQLQQGQPQSFSWHRIISLTSHPASAKGSAQSYPISCQPHLARLSPPIFTTMQELGQEWHSASPVALLSLHFAWTRSVSIATKSAPISDIHSILDLPAAFPFFSCCKAIYPHPHY